VINGDANVTAPTAERVKRAIQELGYSPNLVARSLRMGHDNAIALVVASISDPFFADITASIEEVAREHGYFVMVACTGEGEDAEQTIVTGLLTRQVAGLILVPTAASQAYLVHRYSSAPVVCVDRPAVGADCDAVLVDNEQGAFAATTWLISHGHRRVAFVGGPSDKYTIKLRRSGYQRALEEAGITPDPELTRPSAVLPSEAAALVPHLLTLVDPVTAILTSNAKASLGVVAALHSARRTDVAMVGFDDFPMAAALVPPVTVVSQSPTIIGRRAAELMFDRIGGANHAFGRLVLPTSLVVRGSGELAPRRSPGRRGTAAGRRAN
jgi:LacI family transcriptional regulator